MHNELSITIGHKIGRLTIICKSESVKGHTMYKCLCDCGNYTTIRTSAILSGNTKSCGCLNDELRKKTGIPKRIPGVRDENGKITPEYNTWRHMISRCYRISDPKYRIYGARGICVCDRWLQSFSNFFSDMGKRLNGCNSIDRIDVNGNYEPGNCIWSTPKTQSKNKRNNIWILVDGKKIHQAEFARMLNVNPKSIEFQRKRGKSAKEMREIYKLKGKC